MSRAARSPARQPPWAGFSPQHASRQEHGKAAHATRWREWGGPATVGAACRSTSRTHKPVSVFPGRSREPHLICQRHIVGKVWLGLAENDVCRILVDLTQLGTLRDGAMQVISGPDHNPKFVLRAALKGLDAATSRFNGLVAQGTGPEEVFIPLSETFWWTVTVDDGFEGLAASGDDYRPNLGDYRFARENNPNGRFLGALRYARDRCGYQRALATGGRLATPPLSVPFSLDPVICWRPTVDLPPSDPRFANAKLQGEYDRLLSGRPASEALGSTARWFAQERTRAGL